MQTQRAQFRHPLHDDFEELRTEALRRLIVFTVAISVGLLCVGLVDRRVGEPEIWIVVAAMVGTAATCSWLVQRSRVSAAVWLYLGLFASTMSAAVLYSSPHVPFALPLVLMVFPLLVGYRMTCVLALGTDGLIGSARFLELTPILDDTVIAIIVLTVISLLLSWVALRPISTTIDWAWASYQGEQRKTDEVRLRQAELAQISKSLAEACERLEEVNVELSIARRMAEEARHLKDQFVTTISHELRTPLNLIIGFSEMIVNGQTVGTTAEHPSDPLRRDIETIYRNACHLSTLVDDVLDLGRLEAHRLAMRKEWSSLSTVISDAIESVSALFDRAGLWVTSSLPPDLPDLYLDPTRVRQVLINLLANAVRYVEEGGVRVTARRDGGDVIVAVSDTGVGIPLDDLPYVFEPFRQTGQLRRRGGFGLGLTVSKQFVEMHGGSMWVESELDHGTAFLFSLPVTDNVAAVAPGTGVRDHRGVGAKRAVDRTVLLLDRDVEGARVFERYLDDYRVLTATSAAEAARLERKERISAIIVATGDAHSPDDLAHLASRNHSPIPVVSCALRTKTSAGRHLGAAAFLSKPVRTDEIQATVHRLKPRPKRILVVDDDPEMVRLLEATLRKIAPTSLIRSAADGEHALRVVETGFNNKIPDLMFLDLLMPNLDGRGFLRACSEDPRWRQIPIVIVSAASEEHHDVITCESVHFWREGGLNVSETIQLVRSGLGSLSDSLATKISEVT